MTTLATDVAIGVARAIAPDPTLSAYNRRDWDVLEAARNLLITTGQWDGVYLTQGDDRTVSTDDTYSAVLQILDADEVDDRDDWDETQQLRKVRWTLTLIGRGDDPEVRDRRIDQLQGIAQNVLDGQCLATLTLPDLTKLRRGRWEKPKPPERRLTIVGEFTYLIEDYDAHDTSD